MSADTWPELGARAVGGVPLVVPTESEMLRIKAVLILKRNATRDYLDFVALGERLSPDGVFAAMASLDELYPKPNGESALQQSAGAVGPSAPL